VRYLSRTIAAWSTALLCAATARAYPQAAPWMVLVAFGAGMYRMWALDEKWPAARPLEGSRAK
jgi:hypothetical protein